MSVRTIFIILLGAVGSSQPPILLGQVPLTTAQIIKRVAPSVVMIEGKTGSTVVLGSGFIVSRNGKIATNLHVIRDLKSARVQMADGELFESISILAIDVRRDLAIIRVTGFNLPSLELGDSSAVVVGEPVVVVGSPQGLEGTATAGILSSVRDSGEGSKVLQTDAAVNPGNSGGPLLNSRGQAIGVVSFKLRSSEGLNFAIPINYVREMLSEHHQPMSLDQMRESSSAADDPTAGLPLKETLEWLAKAVPLGKTQFRSDWELTDGTHVVSETEIRTRVWSFDSCVVTIGAEAFSRPETNCGHCDSLIVTNRYTIPLAALDQISIERRSNTSLPGVKLVGGDGASQRLVLHAKSKDIHWVQYDSRPQDRPVEDDEIAATIYIDESLSKSIASAFRHGADLCRRGLINMPKW